MVRFLFLCVFFMRLDVVAAANGDVSAVSMLAYDSSSKTMWFTATNPDTDTAYKITSANVDKWKVAATGASTLTAHVWSISSDKLATVTVSSTVNGDTNTTATITVSPAVGGKLLFKVVGLEFVAATTDRTLTLEAGTGQQANIVAADWDNATGICTCHSVYTCMGTSVKCDTADRLTFSMSCNKALVKTDDKIGFHLIRKVDSTEVGANVTSANFLTFNETTDAKDIHAALAGLTASADGVFTAATKTDIYGTTSTLHTLKADLAKDAKIWVTAKTAKAEEGSKLICHGKDASAILYGKAPVDVGKAPDMKDNGAVRNASYFFASILLLMNFTI